LSLVTPRKGYKSVESNYKKKIEIPKDWTFEPIGSKINILSGFPFDSKNFDKEIGLPLIRIRDLANTDTKIRYNGNFLKEFTINSGDLLVGMDGEFRPYLWKGNLSLLNQRVCKITTSNDDILNQNFIFYSIKKGLFHYELINIGTTVIHISKTNIEKIKIPLPSLPEQQKIANILSNVDNLIESTGKVITHSKKVKTGLMQKLLTRGIGHVTFKKVPWLFGKEIEIPEEWDFETMEIITSQITYGLTVRPKFVEKGIPLISAREIRTGKINFLDAPKISKEDFSNLSNKCKGTNNDLFFSKTGTIGYVAKVETLEDFAITQNIASLSPKSNKIISEFFEWVLHSNYFRKSCFRTINTTTIMDLQLGELGKINVCVPPLPEQQKIATILSNIDSKITSQEQYKEKLEKLKKSLMQKLLTGEVRV